MGIQPSQVASAGTFVEKATECQAAMIRSQRNQVAETIVNLIQRHLLCELQQTQQNTSFEFEDPMLSLISTPFVNSSGLAVIELAQSMQGQSTASASFSTELFGDGTTELRAVLTQFHNETFISSDPNQVQNSCNGCVMSIAVESCNDNQTNQRRLSSNNLSSSSLDLDATRCSPIFFAVRFDNHRLSLKDGELPTCESWTSKEQRWNSDECLLSDWDHTNRLVTCACTQTATVRVSKTLYISSVEMSVRFNLILLSLAFLFGCAVLACCCSVQCQSIDDRPMLARKDSIFQQYWRKTSASLTLTFEQMQCLNALPNKGRFRTGICNACRAGATCTVMCVISNVAWLELRSAHNLLSLIWRPDGTNLSTPQRLACLVVFIALVMTAATLYFAQSTNVINPIMASLVVSLVAAIPPQLLRFLFSSSRPKEEKVDNKNQPSSIRRRDELRRSIIRKKHPFYRCCKSFAWCLILLLMVLLLWASMEHADQFDISVAEPRYHPDCWNNDFKARLDEKLANDANLEQKQKIIAWLLFVAEAIWLSMVFWQSICSMVVATLKVWTFCNNLQFDVGPKTLCKLLCAVCCCKSARRKGRKDNKKHKDNVAYYYVDACAKQAGLWSLLPRRERVTTRKHRPFDNLWFYGNAPREHRDNDREEQIAINSKAYDDNAWQTDVSSDI